MARKKKESTEPKVSPYKLFLDWLFDGNLKSPIPSNDLIKTTSPINHTYILRLFTSHAKLNAYLNEYCNNMDMWYINREELLKAAKQWVHDFKITRNSIPFIPYKRKAALFNVLRNKMPVLKNYDIDLMCDLIDASEDKDDIYNTLGLTVSKVEKIKKGSKKVKKDFSVDNEEVDLKPQRKLDVPLKAIKPSNAKGVFYYTIPEKFYTDEYRLVDVQFLKAQNKVLFIFRDKDNNRVYHTENDEYVCYQIDDHSKARKVIPYDDLNQVHIKYADRASLNPEITYEGDVKIQVKHSQDYYSKNKGEPEINTLNVMYLDIEIYSTVKEFPDPVEAKYPICMLTYEYNGLLRAYVIDNKVLTKNNEASDIEEIEGVDIVVCKTEKVLLKRFIDDLRTLNPDILSGWNCIPKNSNIFTETCIKPISKLKTGEVLCDSVVRNIFPTSYKEKYNLVLANGHIIESSNDHIFPIRYVSDNRYSSLKLTSKNSKFVNDLDVAVKDIMIDGKTAFVKIPLHENKNTDIEINDDILYTLGFIYTDGSISNKKNRSNGYKIYQSDYKLLESFDTLITTKIVGNREKGYSRRIKHSIIENYVNYIYDIDNNKKLNIELLSKLSYRQWMIFLSGMLDGDGFINGNTIELCNFNDDIKSLYTLCCWNGIFTSIGENRIRLIDFKYDDLCLRKSSRWEDFIPRLLERKSQQKACEINYKKVGNTYFVKIKEIINTNEIVEMMDIETDTHYFNYDGVKTHNCISFDMNYIYNRLPKVGLGQNSLSEFGQVWIDGERGRMDIAGLTVVDQLNIYKSFTFGKKENYRLGTIAQLELGQDKLDSGALFSDMFINDVNKAIRYNIRDVTLLRDLENKLKHILLLNQIRVICNNCFASSQTALPQLDSLIISFLKERGLASKNADIHDKGDKFAGAFVKEPIKGIHDFIVDFDFTALYPSLIMTYNVGINTFVMKLDDPKLGYELSYNRDNFPDKVKVIVDPVFTSKTLIITKEQLFKKIEEEDLIHTINGCFYKKHTTEQSYYSEILTHLLSSRKVYKKKMFDAKVAGDEENRQLYNIRQMVYKVLANSIYGILGNNVFRFFNLDCAESITASGQEATKTSILYGNNFVKELKEKKPNVPIEVTKEEMYGDFSRETPYVITADTDSLFITYKKLIKKGTEVAEAMPQIIEWNDQVQKYLNNNVIVNMIKRHRVDPEFNKLELKNEMVANRGIFLAKKRYSINVVLHEGRETNENVTMGLEIKRSDYPSFTKECLAELLDVIFKSKKVSLKKLYEFINDKKLIFASRISQGEKTIARPVSYTKKLGEYKVIPQGVNAMLNWNALMYEAFAPGSRGYLYKIGGLDVSKAPKEVVDKYNKEFAAKGKKLEVIALPDEETKLPEWFVPDTTAMLKFAWDDRYGLILEPIAEVANKFLTF